MQGSAENTAHGIPGKPGRSERLYNLATSRRLIPLVQRIVRDFMAIEEALANLLPEQAKLERERRCLPWKLRARRYELEEEIKRLHGEQKGLHEELQKLEVELVDAQLGRLGFPTIVNGRRALFSWQLGEDGVRFWHFPNETSRRRIPASWAKLEDLALGK